MPQVTSGSYFVSCVNSKTTQTQRPLTYSIARVIEVTAWQSVDAICHCCLTLMNAVLKSMDQSILATLLGANACQTRVLSSVHAIST